MRANLLHAALAALAMASWTARAEMSEVPSDTLAAETSENGLLTVDPDSANAEEFTRPGFPGGGHGGGHGRPGGGWGRIGHGHYPRPGWRTGWHVRHHHHRFPHWYRTDIVWPLWVWVNYPIPAGYWQCTAFDENLTAYSDIGPTADQAAWNALYDCGGDDPEANGCYIPEGYCRFTR